MCGIARNSIQHSGFPHQVGTVVNSGVQYRRPGVGTVTCGTFEIARNSVQHSGFPHQVELIL